MRRVRQKFAESEMNQHFGKILATHFHVINTTQASHIYQTKYIQLREWVKQLIFMSSIQHKLHIHNHFIHSNKVHIYVTIQYNNHSCWRRKQVRFSRSLRRGASTYIYIKQSRDPIARMGETMEEMRWGGGGK